MGELDYVALYDPHDPKAAMFFEVDYYGDPGRGTVPQWTNRFAVASWLEWLTLNAIDGIAENIAAPLLHIHRDNCVLPDNVRRFYELVQATKELHWFGQGGQTDFYDQEPYVSKAAQIAAVHFRNTLI